jgi:hypothetical protein
VPVGTFVLHFLDPDSASSDLPLRRDLALTVRPIADEPRRLFQMVLARDVLFALCP